MPPRRLRLLAGFTRLSVADPVGGAAIRLGPEKTNGAIAATNQHPRP